MAVKIPPVPKSIGATIASTPKPKAVNPKSLFAPLPKAPKKPKSAAPSFDPYAGLMVKDPYDAASIDKTAQQGYTSDLAQANQYAGMGLPTDDSLTAQAAARAAGLAQIAQALHDHLAGIQQAGVAQGNQQGATLGGLNAGSTVLGAAPSPDAGAAQTTLAGQTAGTGNYLGTVEAGADLLGSKASSDAITAGQSAVTQNDQARQKALAGFLSGIPTVAARTADMQDANSKTEAANAATKLNVWNTLQGQIEQDKLQGDKDSLARDTLVEKKWEANQSNETKTGIAKATNATKTANVATQQAGATGRAKIAAAAKAKAATGKTLTPASRSAAINDAIKILKNRGGTKGSATTVLTQVNKIAPVNAEGKINSLVQPTPVSRNADQPYTPKPGFALVGPWSTGKTKSTPTVTGRAGYYRLYNEGIASLKAKGFTQAEATAALEPVYKNLTAGRS